MDWIRTTAAAGAAMLAVQGCASARQTGDQEAKDALLAAFGDRAAWASATGYRILEVHVSEYARLPYTHETWASFDDREVVIRVKNQDLQQLRGLNDDDGWWIQEGDLQPYAAEFLEAEKARWRGNLFRTIARLASGDLGVTAHRDGAVIEVKDDGVPLIQLAMGADGAPVSFVRPDNFEIQLEIESMEAFGEVAAPAGWATTDGRFRTYVLEFELYADGGPEVSFDPPEDPHDLTR